MNVRTKLRGAFAIYIALVAGLSVYHVRTTHRVVTSGHDLAQAAARLRAMSTVQLSRIAQASDDAKKFLVTKDRDYLTDLQQVIRAYEAGLRHLDSLRLSAPERALMPPLFEAWREAESLAAQLRAPPDSISLTRFQESLDRVHLATQALGAASQDAMNQELDASEESEGEAERVTVAAAAIVVLLSLLLSALLARSILEPLTRLAAGTREVSAGHFDHRIAAKGSDELAQVAREFNSMTERLDEVDRMKREFVSKMSHDLKTPLSSMQETTRVLLDEVAGSLTAKQRQLLVINQESEQRLSAMLTKLLDLSRIEAGVEPEWQVVDVRPLIRRRIDRLTEGSHAGRVSLSINESPQRLLVRGDPDALIQVFDNLLENALKFSPFDGQVAVRIADLTSRTNVPPERWATLRRRGLVPGAVLVTVSDEGPGIADDEKERVFTRFYQTDAGRAVRGRGVGLGLAICREIIASHGGAIWASDNHPRGSVFCVLLPAAVRVGGDAPASAVTADGTHRA